MDPPSDQPTLGSEARRLRHAAGLSAREVAADVAERAKVRVEHQDVTAWERGTYGPGSRSKVEALDAALDAGGTLLALWAGDSAIAERLANLEERFSRIEEQLQELLRRRR